MRHDCGPRKAYPRHQNISTVYYMHGEMINVNVMNDVYYMHNIIHHINVNKIK